MKTKTLESVLQEKVSKRIELGKARAIKTLQQIQEDSAGLNDYHGYLGKGGNFSFHSNGVLKAVMGEENYSINSHAISQAGGRLGIPTKYIRELAQGTKWERDLAANILNDHSENSKINKVLVRTVGDQVRGIVSERYKRLNTSGIYAQFLDATNRNSAVVIDAHLSETKSYLETMIPQMFKIETPNNGDVHVMFGARISNSDFGAGSLEVRTFMMQAVCLNGMVRESALKQKHLGSKISDDILSSQRTVDLDTEAQGSYVNDVVGTLLSKAGIKKQIESIQASSAKEMDMQGELKKLSKSINKAEVSLVEKVLMENNPNDGIAGTGSAWKMSQAITAVARDTEDGMKRRDLEEIGGSYLIKL